MVEGRVSNCQERNPESVVGKINPLNGHKWVPFVSSRAGVKHEERKTSIFFGE